MKDILFPKFKPISEQDLFHKLLGLFRYAIFISFYVLSIRFIFIQIDHAPIKNPILLIPILFTIAILSLWKTLWCLYGFLIIIPLVSGLQMLGFMQAIPFISLIFATIYLSYLPKRLFFEKGDISPWTKIGNLADILSAIVLLSLIFMLVPYPLDVIVDLVWYVPSDMHESFYSIEAAYIILQGLFFYRVAELEINSRRMWFRLIPVLYLQASIIIFFSMLQWVFRKPTPLKGFAIYSPFDDIHSYGSYIVLLCFVFMGCMLSGSLRHRLINGVYWGFFSLLVVLSYSRGTWLAAITVGTAFIIHKLSIRKKFLSISCLLIILLYVNLFPNSLLKSSNTHISRLGQLVVAKELFSESGGYVRIALWKRASSIISDFPITGSGIGTFYRISPLYEDLSKGEYRDFYENAHNYFLQLASDLGLLALLVFLGILFHTYRAGLTVLSENGESSAFVRGLLFGLSAYLITCLTSHPLLLLNQQFLFWFIIASIVIPQGFINQQALSDRVSPKPRMLFFLLAAMFVGAYVYELWGMTGKEHYEYGFYPYELWDGKRVRWTAKRTALRTFVTGRLVAFDVYTSPYNIDSKGLSLKIFVNKELWDEVHFTSGGTRNLKYYIPYKKNEPMEIKTGVNRTFIPIRLGLSKDARHLGVALGEMKFYDEIPKEGVGFWATETWRETQIQGWPKNIPVEVRWTGLRASMNIENRLKDGITLFLKVAHPDAEKNPVKVKILCDSRIIEEVTFTDYQWKRIHIDAERLRDSKVLTFHANRTWNPKLLGLSEDSRDLGVAVAMIKPVSSNP